MKRILIYTCCFFFCSFVTEDPFVALAKISEVYAKKENIQIKAEYQFYKSRKSEIPTETAELIFARNSSGLYMESNGMIVLSDLKHSMVIDTDAREIDILSVKEGDLQINPNPLEYLDAIKSSDFELDYIDLKEYARLTLSASKHSNTKMTLDFEKGSYLLKKTIVEIDVDDPSNSIDWNKGKIITNFKSQSFEKKALPHNISDYVKLNSKGKFFPIGVYKNYKINQKS